MGSDISDTILVYGLSADPVHQGHIDLATQATQTLARHGRRVSGILLIPVYRRNPVGVRKDDLPQTYAHRYAMCALAAMDIRELLHAPGITVEVSQVEAELAQARMTLNTTAETLAVLRERSGVAALMFLMSSEIVAGQVPQLTAWYRVDQILRLAELVICPRPGYPANETYLAELRSAGARILELSEVHTPDVASREIRHRLYAGEDPLSLAREGLLSLSVAHYVRAEHLYSSLVSEAQEF